MATDPVRDEAERLVAAAIAAVSMAARGLGGGVRQGFATGSAECCVCPVCRVISAMREPSPELSERLASGAGDLAAGVTSLLRAFSPRTGPESSPTDEGDAFWEALRRQARPHGDGDNHGYDDDAWAEATNAANNAANDAGTRASTSAADRGSADDDTAFAPAPPPAAPPAPKPMARKAVAKKAVAKKAVAKKVAGPHVDEPGGAEPARPPHAPANDAHPAKKTAAKKVATKAVAAKKVAAKKVAKKALPAVASEQDEG